MIQRVDNLNDGESDDIILENRTHPQPEIMISNAIWDDATANHGHDHYRGMYEDTATWNDPDEVEAYYDELGSAPTTPSSPTVAAAIVPPRASSLSTVFSGTTT